MPDSNSISTTLLFLLYKSAINNEWLLFQEAATGSVP